MASKGPNITPYAFSHNNPVMLVDPDGNWPFPPAYLIITARHGLEQWMNNISGAAQRLGTGTSGEIPESAPVPPSVRNQLATQAKIEDATTVIQGAIDIVEGTGAVVVSIPVVETVADGIGLFYNIAKGDAEGIATYSLALSVPGISANLIKLGKGGFKLANKLLKYSANGKSPTPFNNGVFDSKNFTRLRGTQGIRHNNTGVIYHKSDTTHRGKDGEWKIYPKGTTDFSNSPNRITTDMEGNIIGQ
jgi:hypothetical protein